MTEARSVRGVKDSLREAGVIPEPGGIIDHHAVDHLGVVQRQLQGNPAAHGPASNVGLLQAEGMEEVDDELLLGGDGVVRTGWLRRAAIAQQVESVDMEAVALELRNHRRPGLGSVAQPMHQDQGNSAAGDIGLCLVVVNAALRRHDVVALHMVQKQAEVCGLLLYPKRL